MTAPEQTPADGGRVRGRQALVDLLWACALVAGATLLWETRVTDPDAPYSGGIGDLLGYFLPAYEYQAERMAAGALPFWNPWQGAGVPFLATLQPGALYPPRVLLFWLPPLEAMYWWAYGHVLLALLGTYGCCRRLGTSPIGAALAAVVVVTGFAIPWMHALTILEPGCWLPLLAWAVVAILRGGGWGWVLVLGAGAAMPILGGGYQVSVYTVYALGIVALAVVLDGWWRGRPVGRAAFGRLAVAGVLAVATAAPQVLPTLLWSAETMRPTEPLTKLQLMPLFTEAGRWTRLVTYFVRQTPGDVAHLSVPVVALAAVGLVAVRPIGLVFGLAAVAIGALAATGFHDWRLDVYRAIPGFGMFRFPVRLVVLVPFFTGVAAALGLGRLTAIRALAPAPRRLLVEGAALAVVMWTLVVPLKYPHLVPWAAPADVTAPDARFFPDGTGPRPDRRAWVPGGRLDLRAGMFVRQGMRRHVRVLQDYEPLSSARLRAFLAAVADKELPPDLLLPFAGSLLDDPPIRRPELLDLVAVESVMTSLDNLPGGRVPGWTQLTRSWRMLRLRNERALPRAYVVHKAHFVPDDAAALATITAPGFDGHSDAALVDEPTTEGARVLAAALPTPAVPATIVRDDPEHLTVDVAPTRPGVLIVADAYAPGWEATVDGRPRPVLRANYLVRGVLLGAGERRVELRYRAPGFAAGVAALGAGWTAVLAALAWTAIRRRARHPHPLTG